ncbi:MAG: tetratricopeptide repeat protein [Lachnospiraceae bacterium]|nr:tetratricopeptide repeat protein [Lachnospiraceae bacterium]MDE6743960.1 tetratricopeptide repeat protein [Lachnospiraceae bacterium]
MLCYQCGCRLSELDYCTGCGADVRAYKRIMYAAEYSYNDGLERARVRDLSGAVNSLRQCLKYNKQHVDARNLLGLIYFECGEVGAALIEWVISATVREEKNLALDYMEIIQSNQGRLDIIRTTIKKYNVSLELCQKGDYDMAIIQLRKVLNQNPKFVKAHQLLGLLYVKREEWEKAKREFTHSKRIDGGDVKTLRYLKEVEEQLDPDDIHASGRTKKRQKEESAAIYKSSGNDVIIQPLNGKEPLGINAFIQIALGIVIGLCVTIFLITPSKVQSAQDELKEQISGYVEQLDWKNTEIVELETRISQLEQSNLSLQDKLNALSGSDGALREINELLAAAYAALDSSQDAMSVEQHLGAISQTYVEQEASQEFLDLYNYLRQSIGDSVSQSYYNSGLDAYNRMDYPTAITHLGRAYQYDRNNDDALYYLGLAYMDSGDVEHAAESFNQLIELFPNSTLVTKAQQKLAEIAE